MEKVAQNGAALPGKKLYSTERNDEHVVDDDGAIRVVYWTGTKWRDVGANDEGSTLREWALAKAAEVDRLTRERDEARAALARVQAAAKAYVDGAGVGPIVDASLLTLGPKP